MAAMWNKVASSSFIILRSQRGVFTTAALNAKAKNQEDPIKKLFLDKLNEFKSKGNVPMTPALQKEYDGELERLKRVYGGDKDTLSEFPKFDFK